MIKTVSINLGGLVFQVNEDAFATLQSYMHDLKAYYKHEEGGDEIVSDIESRFAELFSESLYSTGREVISDDDVLSVINLMGKPQEFDSEEDRSSFEDEKEFDSSESKEAERKLFRDKDGAVISGVCSGLSSYLGIADPIWIRLLFIVIVLFGGSGILIYLVAWLIIPEAKTASDKLRMQGKPVNITNLESRIKGEMYDAGNSFKEFVHGEKSSGGNALAKIVNGIGRVFGFCLKAVWIFAKVILAIIAFSLILALGAALIAIVAASFAGIPWASANIISDTWMTITGSLGLIFLVGIPVLALMYIPIRMFSNYRVKNNRVFFIAAGLWLSGIIMTSVTANTVKNYFSEGETVSSEEYITGIESDTLILQLNKNFDDGALSSRNFYRKGLVIMEFDEWTKSWLDLDIRQSVDEGIYLEKTMYASGKNSDIARENASAIDYSYLLDGNKVTFDPAFQFGKGKKWREQTVSLNLYVPEGTTLIIENELGQILDDVPNSMNLDAHYIAGSDWIMSGKKLVPADSSWTVDKIYSNVSSLREMEVSDFDEIDISGAFDIEISQSDHYKVLMSNAIDEDLVDFQIEGDKLNISWGKNYKIFQKLKRWQDPKIFIELPELRNLSVSGASDCNIKYFEQNSMKISIKGASDLEADLFTEQLDCYVAGASEIELVGQATDVKFKLIGASEIDAAELEMESLSIEMAGASEVDVHVSKEINGKLSGASTLNYIGEPTINVKSSGASEVVNRN